MLVRVDGSEAARVEGAFARPGADPVPEHAPLSLGAELGFFAAGGANVGPSLDLGASFGTPWWDQRVSLDLGLGMRTAALSRRVGAGLQDSRIWAFPLEAGGRARMFEDGPWAVDARAGLGMLAFQHRIDAPLQATFSETGLGFLAYAGVQGLYRIGSTELLCDLRGDFARARTSHLDAFPGGLVLSVGARWGLQ
jgi:hypothetical protein